MTEARSIEASAVRESCDFTAPIDAATARSVDLSEWAARWEKHARYHVTRSYYQPDTLRFAQTLIAHWLPLTEARALAEELQAKADARLNRPGSFTRTLFGIDLHVPAGTAGDLATVGDLVIHEVIEPVSLFALEDSYVVRRFFVIATVTAVTSQGRIESYVSHRGESTARPRTPMIVSRTDVNVEAAASGLRAAFAARDHWGAEFDNHKAALQFLVPFLIHRAPEFADTASLDIEGPEVGHLKVAEAV